MCLAVWRGDLLGKPGPSKYFSVSPLILSLRKAFFHGLGVSVFIEEPWKICCCGEKWTWPPSLLSDTWVAWWEAMTVLQAVHGLWPLLCSAQTTDDWKCLIFLSCKWFKMRHCWNEAVTKLPTSRTRRRFPRARFLSQ